MYRLIIYKATDQQWLIIDKIVNYWYDCINYYFYHNNSNIS